MIEKSGQNGFSAGDYSILGQPPNTSLLKQPEKMGIHKLPRTKRRNADVSGLRQVSSIQLSTIYTPYILGYLGCEGQVQ